MANKMFNTTGYRALDGRNYPSIVEMLEKDQIFKTTPPKDYLSYDCEVYLTSEEARDADFKFLLKKRY